MAINPKYLGSDEYVILHMHTHVKELFLEIFIFIVVSALLGVFLAMAPASWRPTGIFAGVGVYLFVVLIFVVVPFLRWLTTTYTITNHRLITRSGIITRTGHDLPLRRINDVRYELGLIDRILRCGTLILETAAEEPVVLHDIPDVENVHVQMAEVLFGPPEQPEQSLYE